MEASSHTPDSVLDLWFPDDGHQETMESHQAFWTTRMQGGMDDTIIERFADLTRAAALGELDHWAETPRGRLALLIALDQFPRSLWRDTPGAYAQDIKATRLALDGIENGHFDDLEPWEQAFYVIAIQHCEGPDHMERLNRLDAVVNRIGDKVPEHLRPLGDVMQEQHERVKSVIVAYGRHPHRNDVLGRLSTPAEQVYVDKGEFPHNNPRLREG